MQHGSILYYYYTTKIWFKFLLQVNFCENKRTKFPKIGYGFQFSYLHKDIRICIEMDIWMIYSHNNILFRNVQISILTLLLCIFELCEINGELVLFHFDLFNIEEKILSSFILFLNVWYVLSSIMNTYLDRFPFYVFIFFPFCMSVCMIYYCCLILRLDFCYTDREKNKKFTFIFRRHPLPHTLLPHSSLQIFYRIFSSCFTMK